MSRAIATIDGNEAVASVAYRLNEVIAIYPITPSSPMGEWADQWASEGQAEHLGHGARRWSRCRARAARPAPCTARCRPASLTTTFTASQGLLLMIPNMYKIAGELTPTVFHVAARSLAAQALSIFGDHSDVMAARATGFAHAVLGVGAGGHGLRRSSRRRRRSRARIPFLHFFDGFRTSHEVAKIELLVGRRSARADRRRPGRCAPQPRAVAGPSGPARHGAESRRLLPGARDGESVLRGLPGHRAEGDGQVRQARRPRLPACSSTTARRTPSA